MAMGLDPTQYDYEVFRVTSEISKQVFPISLDIDNPQFRAEMNHLYLVAELYYKAKERGGLVGGIQKAWYATLGALTFVRMYFIPANRHELPAEIRMVPVW
jgi:magnesium-protoporphyrin IX monomethyl ester (oxidative) cyclase